MPGWLPGAGFQKMAARCRRAVDTMVNRPWNFAKDAKVSSESFSFAQTSWCLMLIILRS